MLYLVVPHKLCSMLMGEIWKQKFHQKFQSEVKIIVLDFYVFDLFFCEKTCFKILFSGICSLLATFWDFGFWGKIWLTDFPLKEVFITLSDLSKAISAVNGDAAFSPVVGLRWLFQLWIFRFPELNCCYLAFWVTEMSQRCVSETKCVASQVGQGGSLDQS